MASSDVEGLGPVEILAVGFPSLDFDGSIIAAISDLVQRDIVRILDLIVIIKGDDGEVVVADFDELEGEAAVTFAALSPAGVDLLGEEDKESAIAAMPNGTAAAVLVWEDLWAVPTASAIQAAGGFVLAYERVSVEVLQELAAYEGSE